MMDRQKLLTFCGGNEDAVKLITDFHGLFCVWDDCIDRDKPVNHNAVNGSFLWALFGMDGNPFYVANKDVIRAAVLNCVAVWIAANGFEATKNDRLLHQSFVMRCSPYNLFGLIVLLSGGMDNQVKALEYFYSLSDEDSLQSYLAEHKGN